MSREARRFGGALNALVVWNAQYTHDAIAYLRATGHQIADEDLKRHAQELRIIDAALGRVALDSPEVKRLVTIPGVDATVALAIVAAISRSRSSQRPAATQTSVLHGSVSATNTASLLNHPAP